MAAMSEESTTEQSGSDKLAKDELHHPANMEEFAPGFGAAETVTPAPAEDEAEEA